MQEYLITIPLNISGSEAFVALFFCLNIPTVDSIVTRVRSYGGVQEVELFIITRLAYHQEWLVTQTSPLSFEYKRKGCLSFPSA